MLFGQDAPNQTGSNATPRINMTNVGAVPPASVLADPAASPEARLNAATKLLADSQARLITALRRLHLATPPAQRSDLLVELLKDDAPDIRDLGFELVQRELSADAAVGADVGRAAIELLASPSPQTRGRAAALVRQLAPETAADPLVAALSRETDPTVAESLLLAIQRYPSEDRIGPVLAWVERDGPARPRAFETLWELTRAGYLRDDLLRQRSLLAARSLPVSARTPASIYLLDFLGDDNDARDIAQSLNMGPVPVRQAAAQVLVWYGDLQPALLDAASTQAELFPFAAQAQLVHRPTPDGFRLLLKLPGCNTPEGRDSLGEVAQALSSQEIASLLPECSDPALQLSMTEELVRPERQMAERGNADAEHAIASAAWDLAQRAAHDRRFDRVVALIDQAPGAINDIAGPSQVAAMKVSALVAFGRIDLARQVETTPDAWLDAIAWCIDQPHALAAIGACEEQYGSVLSPDQKAMLEAFRLMAPQQATAETGPQ